MSSGLLAVLLLAGSSPALGQLPDVKVPEKFYRCEADKDCAVAGDACRSCGNLIIINRKYLKKFDELDQRARRKKKVVRACEACGTGNAAPRCERGRCRQGATAP